MIGIAGLAGVALVATLAVVLWRRRDRLGHEQAASIALAVTTVLMFAGIGLERVGLGLQIAESSRYVYMGAMLLVPAFALAVDRLGVLASPALAAGRIVLAASVLLNIGSLLSYGTDWADRSACDRTVLSLLAGAPQTTSLAPDYQALLFSPDVAIFDLGHLLAAHAISPRQPATPAEQTLLDQALDPSVRACPPPP